MTIARLRQAGFDDNEIRDYYVPRLEQAGFRDDEIKAFFGVKDVPPLTLKRLGRQAAASLGMGIQDVVTAEKLARGEPPPPPIVSDSPMMQRLTALRKEKQTDPYFQRRQKLVREMGSIPELFPKALPGTSGRLESAVSGMTRFAPAMITTAIAPPEGLAVTFAQITGMKYDEFKEQGVDDERAVKAALMSAAAQTPIEFAGNLLQIKFLGQLVSQLGAKVSNQALKKTGRFISTVIKNATTEGMEEFLQQYPDELSNIYATSSDASAGQVWKQFKSELPRITNEAVEASKVGAIGGGLLAGAGGVVTAPVGLARGTKAEIPIEETPADIREQAKRSTPEQRQELRESLSADHPLIKEFDKIESAEAALIEEQKPTEKEIEDAKSTREGLEAGRKKEGVQRQAAEPVRVRDTEEAGLEAEKGEIPPEAKAPEIKNAADFIAQTEKEIMPETGNLSRGLDVYKERAKDLPVKELEKIVDWTRTQNKYIHRFLGGDINSILQSKIKAERVKPAPPAKAAEVAREVEGVEIEPTIESLQKQIDEGIDTTVKVDAVGEEGVALSPVDAQVTVNDPDSPANKATFNVPIDNIVEATREKIADFEEKRAEKLEPELAQKVEEKPTEMTREEFEGNQPAGERTRWIQSRLNERDIPTKPTSTRGKIRYQNEARRAADEFDKEFSERYEKAIEQGLITKPTPTPKAPRERAERKPEGVKTDAKAIANLRKVATNLKEKAEEKYNQDRQENTARRARMAASAREDASRDIALADTMFKVADKLESGEPTELAKLRNKTQVETLESILNSAKHKRLDKEFKSYHERQTHKDRPVTVEDAKFAKYPDVWLHPDIVQSVVRDVSKIHGGKKLAGKIHEHTTYEDAKEIVQFLKKKGEKPPWQWENSIKDIDRLRKIGIENEADLKAALTELVELRAEKKTEDPIKKLERELVGQKIQGFIQTPEVLADRMVEEAQITEGMDILEPSAGSGNIADIIRLRAGVEPDVSEIVPTLRKLLEAKDYNIVSSDFLEYTGKKYDRIIMNPPFEKGQDITHVKHAYSLLKPEGRVVSIMGEGPFFRSDKQSKAFNEWFEDVEGYSEKLDPGSFKGSKQQRQTGVSGRLVIINKAEVTAEKPDLVTSKIENVVSVLKTEDGTSEVYNDLLAISESFINQGYDTFIKFRRQLRRQLSEVWEKIKHLARELFDTAKRIITSERGAIGEDEGKKLSPGAQKILDDYNKSIDATKEERVLKRSKKPPIIEEKFGKIEKTPKEIAIETLEAAKTREFWDKAETKIFDRLHPIRTFLGDKAYKLHRIETGSQATFSMFLEHGKLKWDESGFLTSDERKKGFIPFLKGLGRDWDKFVYWVAAKRAQNLEKQGRERWLDKDARDSIFKWTGGENNPKWQKAVEEFHGFNKSVLDIAQNAGLIDPAGRKVWEQEFYVPFYRIFENEQTRDEFLKAPRKSRKFISAQIRKLKGAKRKLGDPLENLMHNWMHLISESMRNVARAESFDFAIASKSDLIEEVGFKDVHSFRSPKDKKIVYVTKKSQENVLMFQRGGKPVYFKVIDPDLYFALSNMNAQRFDNLVVRLMGKAKRALTFGATFGPGFRIANLLRDTMHTAMISKSFKPFMDSATGFWKSWTEDPDYISLMASGAGFGSSYVRADDPQVAAKYIKRIIKKEGDKVADYVLNTPKKMLDFWDKVGSASENAARVQLYANLTKQGVPHMEAAFQARDLLDFTMKGESNTIQFLIQITPFLNARMQGLYKLGRTVADKESRKNFIIRGSALAAASMALWWWYRDDDRYKELEDWDRWGYYHFWIGDKHYRIPKPFEVGAIFSSFPEAMLNVLNGNDDTKHIAEFMAYTAKETFAIGFPQLFSPLIEQWANKSAYTGRPIVGEALKGLKPGEQKEPWTSETMQVLAGKMGVSPKRAQELLRGYYSTFGMFILSGSDIVFRNIFDFPDKPAKKIDDYPLVGRFIKQAQPARYTKYQSWFYDLFNEIDQTVKTVNHYKQTGDYKKARVLAKSERENTRYRKRFNKVRAKLRLYSRKIKQIMIDSKLSSEKKADRIDQYIQKRNQLLKQVYETYQSN